MSEYTWVVNDEEGRAISTTETFSSREAAEEWLGAEWESLAAGGGDSVSLKAGDELVYRMSLKPE